MKILFLTLAYMDLKAKGNIYTDLVNELKNKENDIYVINANERRNKEKTNYKIENGVHCLSVKTGNIQKTNIIEKGIATLLIGSQFKRALKKYLDGIKFDLIIYSPPITLYSVVKYIKNRYNVKTYFLLKDIFPQNALDINLMSKSSIIYKIFKQKEEKIYRISDFIGCISLKNKNYILEHNKYLKESQIDVCPNSIEINKKANTLKKEKELLRKKYGISKDIFVMIYGGNLGKPQGIEFLIDVLEKNKNKKNVLTNIIGNGTEFMKIKNYIDKNNIVNAMIYNYMPKNEYDEYVSLSDVGLILLDNRFTIANFPSRLLNYMEFSLPIIAATDKNTDVRECIRSGGFGEWCESGDVKAFNRILNKMIYDKELVKLMGENSRKGLERNFDVKISVNKILSHFNNE